MQLLVTVVVILLVGAVAWFVVGRVVDWSLMRAGRSSGALDPESSFVVTLSEEGVRCERPDGKVESVAWDDLRRVEILTTDEGPFVPDVFWVLFGEESGCVIPWGATGDRELLERLQRLPGFDNEAIVTAAGLTSNQSILCWQRHG